MNNGTNTKNGGIIRGSIPLTHKIERPFLLYWSVELFVWLSGNKNVRQSIDSVKSTVGSV